MSSLSARDAGDRNSSVSSCDSLLMHNSLDDDHKDVDNAMADLYAIPHDLTSFLDRPLARRVSPLLPAGKDCLAKTLQEAVYNRHSHIYDHDHDVHHIQDNHTSSYRGRSRTTRTRQSDIDRLRFSMTDFIKSTVWAKHDTIRLYPSVCGQHSDNAPIVKGIFVGAVGMEVPSWLSPTQGEHLHLHADGSAHMILSLVDAAKAVDSGWAERLALSDLENERQLGSVQYISVYAPKCASELADWKRLVLASVRFCSFTSRALSIRRPERL
ncbi:hypothetical protein SEPCBS57363_000110 [Sporothrix epigloea]|uniref:Luciferase domain-containing protein n=1 Tax=Sporothrix epigloea TaxID=1892477 RepID=A0ABP0D2S2_9PEZI